jgi:signal transduction histidine kinase
MPLQTDGPHYVNGWHTLDSPPIVIAVSVNLPAALRTWRRDALLSLGLTALIALALSAASLQLARQLDARSMAEHALRQREQELIEAHRVAGLGAARFVSPQFATRPSPQLCALLGLPSNVTTIALDTLLNRLIESDRPRLKEALETCLASGTPYQLEVRAKVGDGSERIFWCEGIAADFANGPAPSILAIFQDVTEQRIAEERSSQGERLAAIGRLTGGVAHDFNNLLTVITGYGDLLLARLSETDPARRYPEEIVKAAERAGRLTHQLLAFSRKQILQPQVLELNGIVTEIEKMLRRLIGEDIELSLNLSSDLGRIKADPGQIEQVLVNLAINARDAMSEGGKLTIETANVDLNETYARNHPTVQAGPYVMLAVSDTGCGMDKETQSHIFEPFFTTKELGKGTGLGLSTVYGIVKQSEGNIWVYSEPGRGTTFKIYLPRTGAAPGMIDVPARAVSTRGTETILLVEDEEILRKLAGEILEDSGYTVLKSGNAKEALRLFSAHQSRIHLLITDVVMPGLSGRELAERLTSLDPTLKVLYMSGYTDDTIVRHGVLEEGIEFIQKPFSPETFTRKVREVLERG